MAGQAVSWDGGIITAEAPGTALLTSNSESLLVTVCSEPLQVSLPDSDIALRAGETFQLSPKVNHPVSSEITYSVSDNKIATVNADGLVTALEKGTVTVTAALPNGESDTQTLNIRNRYTVCVDAGHQKEGIYTKVPVGPGSKEMKTALSGGTQGKVTGIHEHELNLVVALLLKEELIKRGYDVVMIRETDTCPMTNPERAIYASESGADIYVRIHADGSDNLSKHGAFTCAPSTKNPFLTQENITESRRLSQVMVDAFCARTGAYNRGLFVTDSLAGCNWCTIPSTVIEMGFMSNAAEDRKMATDAYRYQMMLGIADGIDAYFAEN